MFNLEEIVKKVEAEKNERAARRAAREKEKKEKEEKEKAEKEAELAEIIKGYNRGLTYANLAGSISPSLKEAARILYKEYRENNPTSEEEAKEVKVITVDAEEARRYFPTSDSAYGSGFAVNFLNEFLRENAETILENESIEIVVNGGISRTIDFIKSFVGYADADSPLPEKVSEGIEGGYIVEDENAYLRLAAVSGILRSLIVPVKGGSSSIRGFKFALAYFLEGTEYGFVDKKTLRAKKGKGEFYEAFLEIKNEYGIG